MSIPVLCERMLSLGYYLNDGVFYNHNGNSMTFFDAHKFILSLGE